MGAYTFLNPMMEVNIEANGDDTLDGPTNTPVEDPTPDYTGDNPDNQVAPYVTGDPVTKVIGEESFSMSFYKELLETNNNNSSEPQMSPFTNAMPKPVNNNPTIRTSDGSNFRIFFRASQDFTEEYITRLCRFLDSRRPGQTVTFYLGCSLASSFTMIIGSILSAIYSCPADTNAVCAGFCGTPETMIWCFCNNRTINRYGALTFGGTNVIKMCPFYKYYLDVCFDRAKSINMLTDEQIATIWDSNSELVLTYSDLNNQ